MSDVDVICIQNPFDYIYRDSDVESMSDGHDNMTAYGYNDISDDPSMGWARYAYTMRIWVYNSGFFYLRPTLAAIELLDRVADRLSQPQPSWDQAVFNEELFFPSHPGYVGLHASKRTMDRYMFMNSKILFKEVRKDGNLKKLKPVVIHLNYHPDKLPRMKAVFEFYFSGKQDALEPFPDGSDWTGSDNSMMITGNGKQDALEPFPDGSGSDWSGSDNSITIKGNGKQEALEQFPDGSDRTGS